MLQMKARMQRIKVLKGIVYTRLDMDINELYKMMSDIFGIRKELLIEYLECVKDCIEFNKVEGNVSWIGGSLSKEKLKELIQQ